MAALRCFKLMVCLRYFPLLNWSRKYIYTGACVFKKRCRRAHITVYIFSFAYTVNKISSLHRIEIQVLFAHAITLCQLALRIALTVSAVCARIQNTLHGCESVGKEAQIMKKSACVDFSYSARSTTVRWKFLQRISIVMLFEKRSASEQRVNELELQLHISQSARRRLLQNYNICNSLI